MDFRKETLEVINENKSAKNLLSKLKQYQKSINKNLVNPAISKQNKNEILKMNMTLNELEKSLYKYDKYRQINNSEKIQEEKENISIAIDKINEPKFVWNSNDDACDKCRTLNGKEFNTKDEIPQAPHPNCKCYIEIKNPKPKKVKAKKTTTKKIGNAKWIKPCEGKITSEYGWRIHPVHKKRIFHSGLDIAVPIGTPIKTIADGKIIATGKASGYGYWVLVDHGNINGKNVTSEYGHILDWTVQTGQIVKQGDVIAKSGNTGTSNGPHLHITIRENGTHVDPKKYLNINISNF